MKTDIESVKTLHKALSNSIQRGEYILGQWDAIDEISTDLSTYELQQAYGKVAKIWLSRGIIVDCGLCHNMQLDKTFRTIISSDIPKKKFKKIFGMEKLTGIGTLDAYMGHIWQSCLGKHYSGRSRYPLAKFEAYHEMLKFTSTKKRKKLLKGLLKMLKSYRKKLEKHYPKCIEVKT